MLVLRAEEHGAPEKWRTLRCQRSPSGRDGPNSPGNPRGKRVSWGEIWEYSSRVARLNNKMFHIVKYAPCKICLAINRRTFPGARHCQWTQGNLIFPNSCLENGTFIILHFHPRKYHFWNPESTICLNKTMSPSDSRNVNSWLVTWSQQRGQFYQWKVDGNFANGESFLPDEWSKRTDASWRNMYHFLVIQSFIQHIINRCNDPCPVHRGTNISAVLGIK